jgi:7-cyano-7-deazaguanine synthase
MHAIVLLSGGLDSTTVATHAVRQGYQVRGLSVAYGQRHEREVRSARAVAERLGIPLIEADAAFYGGLASHSALIASSGFDLPMDRPIDSMSEEIPLSYVPLRNTFLVTVAAAALESWLLHRIEVEGESPSSIQGCVMVGANAIDYSGYPDCRPEFYAAMTEVLRLGSKLGAAYNIGIDIEAPIIGMSKADIVRYATELGAPISESWSCYQGGESPCGSCDSCLLRAAGFAEAGLADPALVSA